MSSTVNQHVHYINMVKGASCQRNCVCGHGLREAARRQAKRREQKK